MQEISHFKSTHQGSQGHLFCGALSLSNYMVYIQGCIPYRPFHTVAKYILVVHIQAKTMRSFINARGSYEHILVVSCA